ncbi:MAG: hypothetical protein M1524_02630 [Patescibacteria group bacterium]|nr:hypothetical protein [Patescibacteria group bacterium]
MLNISTANPLSNFLINYDYLVHDYKGFVLTDFISFFYHILINLFVSFFIFLITYLIGKKVKALFFKSTDYDIFIEIAIGYLIIVGGITIIGFFSAFYDYVLSIYFIFIILVAFYPFSFRIRAIQNIFTSFKKDLIDFKLNKSLFILLFLFVILAFLRLQLPEIREDQYHTDLPVRYLKEHTIMLFAKDPLVAIPAPQLGEMYYLIPIFFGLKEVTRYIHFFFYILVILLLYSFSKKQKISLPVLTPLLFASAPEIIRETSSQYIDFQWIYFLLLSTFLLIKNKFIKINFLFLSGVMFGAMLTTRLWTVAFLPAPIIYISIVQRRKKARLLIKYVFIFLGGVFITSFLWYLRAFILKGNPLSPFLLNENLLGYPSAVSTIHDYIGFHYGFLNSYFNVFGPLLYLSIIFFLLDFRQNLSRLKKIPFYIFFIIFFILNSLIVFFGPFVYSFGRYLLALYTLLVIILSFGIKNIFYKNTVLRFIFITTGFAVFSYFFINTILILPYSIGLADKNRYLTRILIRDNSSYYDFDRKFDRFISKDDFVATYGIFGFYYADFSYADINNLLDKKNMSTEILKSKRASKLLIKGGNIEWFCDKIGLADCNSSNYSLVSTYSAHPSYYLYNIK